MIIRTLQKNTLFYFTTINNHTHSMKLYLIFVESNLWQKNYEWNFRHQKPQLVGWSECSQHHHHCFARLLGLQESLINDLYQVCLNKLGWGVGVAECYALFFSSKSWLIISRLDSATFRTTLNKKYQVRFDITNKTVR